MCGGLSLEAEVATEEVQTLIEKVLHVAQEKSGKKFAMFQAVSYKSQVVAGTNYFVKVNVGDGEFVHLRIYQKLPCYGGDAELSAMQHSMTEDQEIVYFD